MRDKIKLMHKFYTYRMTWIIAALVVAVAGGVWLVYAMFSETGIKSADALALGVDGAPQALEIKEGKTKTTYDSPVFETDFAFNAIAPHWKEDGEGVETDFEIRVSENGEDWTQWLEVEAGSAMRENDPTGDRMFPEAPLFVEGKYFQYKVEMKRTAPAESPAKMHDLKMNYIDSRVSALQRFGNGVKDFFAASEAQAAQNINIISRSSWGSPDPHGDEFKGTNKYWEPSYQPAEQIFLHHTVTPSIQSDPAATVRAIWDFHANTRQWGDIGYNYLMDHEGNIYEGRFGGDNVVAGHVLGYNQGSLGVAVMGCFQPGTTCDELNDGNTTAPTNATISNLTTLLSWKTTSFEIDPSATHSFCDSGGNNCLNLRTVSAHRDANDTSCNGQLFYDKMPQIRTDTKDKNDNESWAYAAKQLDYDLTHLNDNKTATVTMRFKNMGTQTWSNSTNRILLRTANPDNRVSDFRGDDWLTGNTPAVLEETSVAPGGTGTFTFTVERDFDTYGSFFEGVRLVSENNAEFKNYYAFRVSAACNAGTTAPDPDGNYRSAMGNADFNGNNKGDILWYGPNRQCDAIWRGSGTLSNFLSYRIHVKNEYRPISGDFDDDGYSDILWYGPGGDRDAMWYSNESARNFASASVNVSGTYTPIAGDFDGDGHGDIFWYGGGGGAYDTMWYGTGSRGQFASASDVNVHGSYHPIPGDFNDDGKTDILWYGAGSDKDALWYGRSSRGNFGNSSVNVQGTYAPFSGDFNGNGHDDIFWYGDGSAYDAMWYGTSHAGSFSPADINVSGSYHPVPNDFNGDGNADILWYGPAGDKDGLWYGRDAKGSFSTRSTTVNGRYIPIY